jgi:hypothetical protein
MARWRHCIERIKPMTEALHVRPYFEPSAPERDPSLAAGSDYVAGFKGADHDALSLHVPLPAAAVEMAVLARAAFSIGLEPDGWVVLRSDGLSDTALEAAAQASSRIPALVTACLDPADLCRHSDPVRDLAQLRADLVAGLAAVDATLARMQRS